MLLIRAEDEAQGHKERAQGFRLEQVDRILTTDAKGTKGLRSFMLRGEGHAQARLTRGLA
jgi:hypothetical protein